MDEIAYNTADLDDAREADLLVLDALRSEVPLFAEIHAQVDTEYPAVPNAAHGGDELEPLKIDNIKFDKL